MDADLTRRESCALHPSSDAPAQARQFVSRTLRAWGVGQRGDDVALLASELVTNAVRHARGEVFLDVSLSSSARDVRVAVRDGSEALPVLGDLARAHDGGWGLHIVERLASHWGVERHPDGKTVWCEIGLVPQRSG